MQTFCFTASFCFSSFFFSLAYSQQLQIGCLSYIRIWCGLSVNLEYMSEMCCTQLAENIGCKNYSKNRRLRTIAQLVGLCLCSYGMYWQLEKNLLNSNISSTYPHNMVNVGPLKGTNRWGRLGVWGSPANFNGFHVLASLLRRHRAVEVSLTLHNVWHSPGLVHYTLCLKICSTFDLV